MSAISADTRADIERRFLATILGDSAGDYLRENLSLAPDAFECFDCKAAWRVTLSAGSVDRALEDKVVQRLLATEAAPLNYWNDRVSVWTFWLRDKGPAFLPEWRELLRTSKARFPTVETEPEEDEILPEVEPIVEGLMEPGDKLIVASGSKSFKTWTLIQLGYCIACGEPWLGFATKQERVLFLNFEIKPRNFWRRVYRVRRALGLEKSAGFTVWNLRGRGFSMDLHADQLIEHAKQVGARVIILDPIYKLLGDRNESSAGDMSTLMALFDRVATEAGAAIVFAHHFAKGSAAGKDSIDRASGSGVFARDPDCIITLTRLDEKEGANTFAASVTLREFAPIDDFAVRREHPIMIRVEDVNVRNLHEPNRRQAKYSAEQLVALLPPDGLSTAAWQQTAREQLGMTRSTFYEYAPAAKKLARQIGPLWLPQSGRSGRSDLGTPDHRTRSESGKELPDFGPDRGGTSSPIEREAA